jgi:hypothetical protein
VEPRPHVDATQHSFDEFVSFIFEHEITAKNDKEWYWNTDVTFAYQQICEHYIRLFRKPEVLFGRFPKPQLEEGFWTMMSGVEWSVTSLIRGTDVPFSLREECVRAMFDLFSRFFASEPLDTSCQMWWDAMCYDWHCGNRVRERGGEDLEMQDVMFQTLAEILTLDSQPCQAAALHGLGHLHHPETHQLIDKYITSHPSLTEAQKEYALAAAMFQVM